MPLEKLSLYTLNTGWPQTFSWWKCSGCHAQQSEDWTQKFQMRWEQRLNQRWSFWVWNVSNGTGSTLGLQGEGWRVLFFTLPSPGVVSSGGISLSPAHGSKQGHRKQMRLGLSREPPADRAESGPLKVSWPPDGRTGRQVLRHPFFLFEVSGKPEHLTDSQFLALANGDP